MSDDLNHLDAEPAPRIRPDGAPAQERHAERSYEESPAGERDVHLLDYVRVLYKRRWLAATVFVLVFGTVAIYTFTATPIYEAKARLLIESDDRNVVNFQQVIDENASRPDYYQTQFNILQSRALARKTLDELTLWPHQASDGDGEEQSQRFSWRSIKGMFGSPAAETLAGNVAAADETRQQSRTIDAFLGNLEVSPIRNSRLVDVRFRSPDPKLAPRVVNVLTKQYIEQSLEYRFLASKEASDWLGERLAEQRKEVEAAELALQRYREQNDAISLEDSENIVVQKLADLNAAVTRAKTMRIEKEALHNQLRASQSNPGALDTFPAILSNVFIQQQKAEIASLLREQAQLGEKLGGKHPEMQRVSAALEISQARLSGEIAKVVQAVRSEYQAALAQERDLTTALNQQKGEALAMNRKAIDYTVLRRDLESSRQIYDSLMQRAKETGVAGELKTATIRVVDAAELPTSPMYPRPALNLAAGLFAGLLVGCGLAFFFEYLDNRIKTPEDVSTHLRLPTLGMLPAIDLKNLEPGRPLLLTRSVPAVFAEALRNVRTNMLFASAAAGSRSIVVTSTGPGEGKSIVASNIAAGLAQTGQRVLLIDADMRRPTIHDVFDVPREPGLSNLLVGQAKASESVRKSSTSGLWLLTAGQTPPNPAELLGSARFADFLRSVAPHFEWVIIDSPPVMAVTDAALIAHRVSGVLFVVGAEMTSRHAAARALDQLHNARAKVVGAVLNRVNLQRDPYYYSQHYRREYARYYVQG